MLIPEDQILSIIPQRPPFVMIGSLLSCDTTRTVTTTLVKGSNVLLSNGEFSEAGLTENIAQTAAAGAGYKALRLNKPVAIGYIGAIKNLEVFKLPQPGDLLETEVIVENEIFDVTIISGTVKCNNVLLARCEMKIFIKN